MHKKEILIDFVITFNLFSITDFISFPLLQFCIVQPAILSSHFPHGRKLHYWAKSSLFQNKLVRMILNDAGNVSVDRRNKVCSIFRK